MTAVAPIFVSHAGQAYSFQHWREDHIWRAHNAGVFYATPFLTYIENRRLRGTFIDVGAHVGNHAIAFAGFCGASHVVAIEAHPQSFACLQHNVAANKAATAPITTLHAAVGDRTTGVACVVDPPDDNTGMARVVLADETAAGHRPRVQLTTLDKVCAGLPNDVVLIKIDVEGFESLVLRGALQLIDRSRSLLVAVEAATKDARVAPSLFLASRGFNKICTFGAPPLDVWERLGGGGR